jgi:hypothetical protein
MNLILKPLVDVNDVTWSVVICLVTLLFGVGCYVYYILHISYAEINDERPDE